MAYKESLLMTIGTILNSVLGLGFYVLTARLLGLAEFGKFSYFLGIGLLAAELTDMGVNAAIVRFGSGFDFGRIISFATKQRLAIITFISFLFLLLAKTLDPNYVYSGAIAVSLLLAYFTTQSLIARQKFGWQVAANIIGNIFRLGLIWWLSTNSLTTTVSVMVVFCIGAVTTFIVGLPILKEMGKKKSELTTGQILRFSLPAAGSFSLSSLASRLDIPILYALAGPVSVGIYSSAQKLVSVLPQISGAIDAVFAPKLSQKRDIVFREYILITVILSIGLLFSTVFSDIAISFLGSQFKLAGPVLRIYLIAFIPFFLAGPFAGAILYRYGKSNYHLIVSAFTLAISLAAQFILILNFKELGAVVSVAVVNMIILFSYIYIYKNLHDQKS